MVLKDNSDTKAYSNWYCTRPGVVVFEQILKLYESFDFVALFLLVEIIYRAVFS